MTIINVQNIVHNAQFNGSKGPYSATKIDFLKDGIPSYKLLYNRDLEANPALAQKVQQITQGMNISFKYADPANRNFTITDVILNADPNSVTVKKGFGGKNYDSTGQTVGMVIKAAIDALKTPTATPTVEQVETYASSLLGVSTRLTSQLKKIQAQSAGITPATTNVVPQLPQANNNFTPTQASGSYDEEDAPY